MQVSLQKSDVTAHEGLNSWLQTQFHVQVLLQKSYLTLQTQFHVQVLLQKSYLTLWQHVKTLQLTSDPISCEGFTTEIRVDGTWRLYRWLHTQFHVIVLLQKSDQTACEGNSWLQTQFHIKGLPQKSDQTACEDNSWLQTQILVNGLPQKSDLTAH